MKYRDKIIRNWIILCAFLLVIVLFIVWTCSGPNPEKLRSELMQTQQKLDEEISKLPLGSLTLCRINPLCEVPPEVIKLENRINQLRVDIKVLESK
ncbi:MAG: hypothetical protein NT178_16690 [Proteobacteria bacterium]|nr:hypothetical protein [Pseudomonadota bacterium]